MEKLSIMSVPPVEHIQFGIFNLALPNIAFWMLVLIVFALAAWARIPKSMESDHASRRMEADQ